jgi:hypothetical protein
MSAISGVVQQLKKEHERLTREIHGISAALAAFGAAYGKSAPTRRLSAAARARISAAQRARWAKVRGNAKPAKKPLTATKKRTMSASARRKIAAAQRARWASVKSKQRNG